MIRRIWHFLAGHLWTEERQFLPPADPNLSILMYQSDYYERYGATIILERCVCGAIKRTKIVGRFDGASSEVAELRRMAKL